MPKPHVTITGNVGNDPVQRTTNAGTPVALFSVAQHHWRPGPRNTWEDAGTSWYDVVCRWGWSENVATSLKKGQPVVVVGKLKINEKVSEHGEVRVSAEIDAISVGHDLRRGVSEFSKVERARSQMPNDEDEISDMLDASRPAPSNPWEQGADAADGSEPPAGDGETGGGDGEPSGENPPVLDDDGATGDGAVSGSALQPAV